jgi:uncharacterized protein YqfB (UPF0267 family)
LAVELTTLFEKNLFALGASLDEVLQGVLPEYEKLRQAGEKSELSHIYVSFLRSGVLCKQPWLRVDLYDDKYFDDIAECGAKWDIKVIANKLYQDADLWAKERGYTKDYELEQHWFESIDEYFEAFDQFFLEIIIKCDAAKELNCEWHFGEFMGNASTEYYKLGQDRRIPYAVVLNKLDRIGGYRESLKGDLSSLDKIIVSPVYSSQVNFYPDILDRQLFMIKDSVKDVFEITGFLNLMVEEEKFVVIRKTDADTVVLSLIGQMHSENVAMILNELVNITEEHVMPPKPVTVYLDMEKLSHISPEAAVLLSEAITQTAMPDRKVSARNVSVDMEAALREYGLAEIL